LRLLIGVTQELRCFRRCSYAVTEVFVRGRNSALYGAGCEENEDDAARRAGRGGWLDPSVPRRRVYLDAGQLRVYAAPFRCCVASAGNLARDCDLYAVGAVTALVMAACTGNRLADLFRAPQPQEQAANAERFALSLARAGIVVAA